MPSIRNKERKKRIKKEKRNRQLNNVVADKQAPRILFAAHNCKHLIEIPFPIKG